LLACQGPDTSFFYGYNIKKRDDKKDINSFGFYLHSINPTDLYHNMLAYAFKNDGEEKEILIEFTRGFVYHYLLDRTIHPYVFYNTGFPYTNKKYNLNHGFFEGSLDTALMKKNNCNISNRKAIKANKKYVKLQTINRDFPELDMQLKKLDNLIFQKINSIEEDELSYEMTSFIKYVASQKDVDFTCTDIVLKANIPMSPKRFGRLLNNNIELLESEGVHITKCRTADSRSYHATFIEPSQNEDD
jgi:hypothetical protein